MLCNLLQTKKLVIVLLLLGLFLCPFLYPSSSFAQVCFDEATARKMIVVVEQKAYCEEQLDTRNEEIIELEKQKELMRTTEKLQADQIAVYQKLIELNKQASDLKDKTHAEELKNARPTFMDNLGKIGIGIGIGVALTAGAVLVAF